MSVPYSTTHIERFLWKLVASINAGVGPRPDQRPDPKILPGTAAIWDAVQELAKGLEDRFVRPEPQPQRSATHFERDAEPASVRLARVEAELECRTKTLDMFAKVVEDLGHMLEAEPASAAVAERCRRYLRDKRTEWGV